MSDIQSPHDVQARLASASTGLRERAIEMISSSKTLIGGIIVKIQTAGPDEVDAVMRELSTRGWSVSRGSSAGSPVLVLAVPAAPEHPGERRTTTGQIHAGSGETRAPEPRAGSWATRPIDEVAARRAIERSKSLAEAASALQLSPGEVEEYMRGKGIEQPPAWGAADPTVVDAAHLRNVVTMASSPQVAAAKLKISVEDLLALMGQHQIDTPKGWPPRPPEAPRASG